MESPQPETALTPKEDESAILYKDDFATLNPGWANSAGYLHVKNNKLVLQPPTATNKSITSLYEADKFADADTSIDLQLGRGADGTGNAGLAFWADDPQNEYILAVSEQGRFAVARYVKGHVTFPVAWQSSDAVKRGAEAVNHLRVVTNNSKATVYVNGKELVTITGQPPDGGGFMGVACTTSEKTEHEWEFSNFTIKKPSR